MIIAGIRAMQEQNPEGRLSGMTTDPVCGMKVDENNSEFVTKFAGKKYVFCSEQCQKEFEKRPEEFVETAA